MARGRSKTDAPIINYNSHGDSRHSPAAGLALAEFGDESPGLALPLAARIPIALSRTFQIITLHLQRLSPVYRRAMAFGSRRRCMYRDLQERFRRAGISNCNRHGPSFPTAGIDRDPAAATDLG